MANSNVYGLDGKVDNFFFARIRLKLDEHITGKKMY